MFRRARHFVRQATPILILVLLTACTSGPAESVTPTSPPPPATATATAVLEPTAPPTAAEEPTHEIPTEIPTIALPPPPTAPPTATGIDAAQLTLIYSLVVHDLVAKPAPGYIAIAAQAAQGELLDTPSPDRPVPPELIGALSDYSATVELTTFMEAIGPLESGGRVRNDGVFLTMGVVQPDPTAGADGITLYASTYRASDDATGYLYRIYRDGDKWAVKDKTQTWDH